MKSPKRYGFADMEFNKYSRPCLLAYARALGSFQVKIAAIVLALVGAVVSQVALAQVDGGWVRGYNSNGSQSLYSSSNLTQAQAQRSVPTWQLLQGVPSAGQTSLQQNNSLKFPGTPAFGVATRGVVTGAAVFATFKAIAGGPTGVVIAGLTLAPALVDWLASGKVRPAPVGAPQPFEAQDPDVCTTAPCFIYKHPYSTGTFTTYDSACSAMVSQFGAQDPGYTYAVTSSTPTQCNYMYTGKTAPFSTSTGGQPLQKIEVAPATSPWVAASIEAIRAQMEKTPSTTAGITELLNRGGSLPIAYAPGATTGPASVSGPPVVSSTTAGDVTTTTTTTPKTDLTYGTGTDPVTGKPVPTVTGTTNTVVVITTINNVTGATTTNNTTTTNPGTQAEPAPDPCASNPDRVGCLDIDTPEGVIPKADKNVSYAPETLFGAGSCPPDRTVQQLLTGRAVVLSYAQTCSALAAYVQPIIIAIALMMAYMIILPGNRE